MQIAIIENNTVAQVGDYRELFPNVSFPPSGPSAEWMTENSCLGVTVWKAYNSRTEKLEQVAPYIEGGQVFTVSVTAKTQAEMDADTASQAAQVRANRNQLLKDCDWTQIQDATVDKQAWATYRQALRDISSQTGFPWEVEWPHDPDWVDRDTLV